MEADADYQQALSALEILHDATADAARRKAAHDHCEALKWQAEPQAVATLAVKMSSAEHPAPVRHFGLHLVENLVSYRWKHIPGLHEHFKSWILQYLATGTLDHQSELHFVKEKSAAIAASIATREWPQRWPNFFEAAVEIYNRGPTQSDLITRTLRALVATVYQEGNIVERRRNELKQVLIRCFPSMLGLFHRQISNHTAVVQNEGAAITAPKVALEALLETMVYVAPDVLSDTLSQNGTHDLCASLLARACPELKVLSCEYFMNLVSSNRTDHSEMLPHSAVVNACTQAVSQVADSDLTDQDQYNFHKGLLSVLCALCRAQLMHKATPLQNSELESLFKARTSILPRG